MNNVQVIGQTVACIVLTRFNTRESAKADIHVDPMTQNQ